LVRPAAGPVLPTVPKVLAITRPAPPPATGTPAPLLAHLRTELQRNLAGLRSGTCPAPHFLGYAVNDTIQHRIRAGSGALEGSARLHARQLTVDLRVGTRAFDNTHFLERRSGANGGTLPLDDDGEAIRTALWLATDASYLAACKEYARVKAKAQTTSKEDDPSADFAAAPVVNVVYDRLPVRLDVPAWEGRLRRVSAVFRAHPEIRDGAVELNAWSTLRVFVTSEGTVTQVPEVRYVLTLTAQAIAEDGMDFQRFESFFGGTAEALPAEADLTALARSMVADLLALRKAPLAEPYEGPAIFRGRAAAVFFHEVFGHRMEGHRQKLRRSDQTFTRKVGEEIMPRFLSIWDDPLLTAVNGQFVNGHFLVDDEGVRPRRVDLVKDGVLKGFLMSRTPIRNFPASTGHGRRSPGLPVVARQANLVVEPAQVVAPATLRKALIDEARRQGKPYGLVFEEVSGGFTFTDRSLPQAFKVLPIIVRRVYVDGRPDELVRGVDLVGTPLTALTRIVVASSDFETFNGVCGAESGWVPVSATAPSLLLSKIETQRKEAGEQKQPILPVPVELRRGGVR
jgi:predicted Zn-dependent protease